MKNNLVLPFNKESFYITKLDVPDVNIRNNITNKEMLKQLQEEILEKSRDGLYEVLRPQTDMPEKVLRSYINMFFTFEIAVERDVKHNQYTFFVTPEWIDGNLIDFNTIDAKIVEEYAMQDSLKIGMEGTGKAIDVYNAWLNLNEHQAIQLYFNAGGQEKDYIIYSEDHMSVSNNNHLRKVSRGRMSKFLVEGNFLHVDSMYRPPITIHEDAIKGFKVISTTQAEDIEFQKILEYELAHPDKDFDIRS